MPVVLLLRNGDAVILTKRISVRSKRAGGAATEVVMPGAGGEMVTRHRRGGAARYSGYALLAALKAAMVGGRQVMSMSLTPIGCGPP